MSNHRSFDLTNRSLLGPLVLALTMAIVFSSLGCSFGEVHFDDPFDREYSLGEAQHRYTTLVRFGDFERASDIPFEFEIAETQVWSRDGMSNDWQVSSTFEGLQNLAAN